MPEDMNPRAVPGGNNPPVYREDVVEAHDAKAREFLDAAGEWLDIGEITDEAQAGKLTDFVAGVKAVIKTVDEDRKADKKIHDERGKQVQRAYTPIIEALKKAVERVEPLQRGWLKKVEERQRAEAERLRKEAEEAARLAEEQAKQAESRHDVAGEAAAEAAAKEAERLQREARRAKKARAKSASASGGTRSASLRTSWRAEITNIRVAFLAFEDAPEAADLIRALAERKARSSGFDPEKDSIPGIRLHKTEKAV